MINTETPATELASRVFLLIKSKITTTTFKINELKSSRFQNDLK